MEVIEKFWVDSNIYSNVSKPFLLQILSWDHATAITYLPLDKMAAILADGIFKRMFLNDNVRISIQISLKCVPKGPN